MVEPSHPYTQQTLTIFGGTDCNHHHHHVIVSQLDDDEFNHYDRLELQQAAARWKKSAALLERWAWPIPTIISAKLDELSGSILTISEQMTPDLLAVILQRVTGTKRDLPLTIIRRLGLAQYLP
jgi:hypothetical protein